MFLHLTGFFYRINASYHRLVTWHRNYIIGIPFYHTLVIAGYHQGEVGRRVRAALDKVGLLGKDKQYPITLSGGEQQRVGIARAVVNRPPLLLADEPTGNLDPELSREIMYIFEEFSQVGVTVLIASHDLALIHTLPYRVLTLQNGQLVNDTEPTE